MAAHGSRDAVAVIGAAAGIGAATARRLGGDGYRVITVDGRDAEVTADLATPAGRRTVVARVTGLAGGALAGLVHVPGTGGQGAGAGVRGAPLHYFGVVALLEGLRPVLARSGHAAVVLGPGPAVGTRGWPAELERLCLDGDEAGARRLACRVGARAAQGASAAALARYVRRHALSPEWIGAGIRLNILAPGLVEPLELGDDLNEDGTMRDLERYRRVAETLAACIAYLIRPGARGFGDAAPDEEPSDARLLQPAGIGLADARAGGCSP